MSVGVRIGHWVVAGLAIVSGIALALILYFFNDKIERANYEAREHEVTPDSLNGYAEYANSPGYIVGVAYLISGVLSVIATCANAKTLYMVEMIVGVITMLVMGGIFIVSMIVIKAFGPINMSFCQSFGRSCICSHIIPNNWHYSCEDLNVLYDMAVGIVAMIVLGLVCTLVATVISGMEAFGNKKDEASSDMQMDARNRTNKI